MDDYSKLVQRIDERLTQEKFRLWRKISMVDALDTDIFASRISWKVGRNSEHIFLQHRVTPTVNDFEQLFDSALVYCKRAYPVPLPLLVWTNYRMICVIATTNVSQQLIEYVTDRPHEHWNKRIVHGYFQMPVLIDLQNERSYYYTGFFRRSLRRIVRTMLGED
jgi:hypothetical protein